MAALPLQYMKEYALTSLPAIYFTIISFNYCGNLEFPHQPRTALLCIAHDPGVRLRDIAASLGITERRAHGIVTT